MKPLLPVVLAGLMLSVATTARAEIEFYGYSSGREGARFVLVEGERVSDWLGIGATFRGHTVTAYDAKAETLTLTREGATVRVRLKGARTTEEIEQAVAVERRQQRSAELRQEFEASLHRGAAIQRALAALRRQQQEAQAATPVNAVAVASLEKAMDGLNERAERADRMIGYRGTLLRWVQDGRDEKHPFFVETQEMIAALRKLEEAGEP